MSSRSFTRRALLAAATALLGACDQALVAPQAPSPSAAGRTAHVTLEWQEQARTLVAAGRLSAPATGRVLAALSVAQQRAVRDVDAGAPAAGDNAGRSQAEGRRGAIAGASVRVLGFFFPAAVDSLEARLAAQGASGAGGVHPQFTRGVQVGRTAGDALVAHVQSDRFTTPWTGTVPTGPGMWIPTTLPPGAATLGGVTPYFLTSASQFRPAPPPAFGSAAFSADLDEVRTLAKGATAEQLAFARYWDFPAGTFTPVGYWNATAAQYVTQHGLDERAATRVFAVMHAAVFDALIGCWEAKYHYWTLRPSQADASIPLAFTLPNFPSYPSGHSCASASAGRVLTHFFPDRAGDLAAAVSDAGLSRMLAGIHYRFDVTAGQTLGRSVADWAIAHAAP